MLLNTMDNHIQISESMTDDVYFKLKYNIHLCGVGYYFSMALCFVNLEQWVHKQFECVNIFQENRSHTILGWRMGVAAKAND